MTGQVLPDAGRKDGPHRVRRPCERHRARPARSTIRSRLTSSWRCAWARTRAATSPRASRCGSKSCSSRCGWSRRWSTSLPPGEIRVAGRRGNAGGMRGIGWVEGWRGEVLIALDTADAGTASIALHPHDPSWQNWPVLEHAVHRQHRSGLSADQQVVQPVATADRTSDMYRAMTNSEADREDRHRHRTGRRMPDQALREVEQRLGEDDPQALRHARSPSGTWMQARATAASWKSTPCNSPYYNLERLGIKFVASPRHADMLLVTGPVSRNMEVALQAHLRSDSRSRSSWSRSATAAAPAGSSARATLAADASRT